MRLAEALLKWVQVLEILAETFDGCDRMAISLDGKHQARPNRQAVEQNGAGTTDTVFATDMRAGEPELMPEEITQEQAWLSFALIDLAIYRERDGEQIVEHISLAFHSVRAQGRISTHDV
jgi:hypothetical protein